MSGVTMDEIKQMARDAYALGRIDALHELSILLVEDEKSGVAVSSQRVITHARAVENSSTIPESLQ